MVCTGHNYYELQWSSISVTVASQYDRDSQIEMKRCDAYELPRLARQKIVTERNPAYEIVGAGNGQLQV